MEKNLSLRSNPQILGLFSEIRKFQPSANRLESFNQALDIALNETVDWKKLSKVNVNYSIDESQAPEFIQLRTEEVKWVDILEKVKMSFTPPLKRTTAPDVLKLVLINYLNYLESIQENKEDICETLTEKLVDENLHFEKLSVDEKLNLIYKKLVELERKDNYEITI